MSGVNDCPFCGSDRTSVVDKWLRSDGYVQKRGGYVHCHTCGARGPLVKLDADFDVRNERVSQAGREKIQADAVEAWNRAGEYATHNSVASLPLFEKGGDR